MAYNLTVSDPDLGLAVDVGWLTTELHVTGNHEVVEYRIRNTKLPPSIATVYEAADLRVPVNNEVRSIELRAMRSLASFLDAYVEALKYADRSMMEVDDVENADLFGDLATKVDTGDLETLVWTIRDIVGEDE
jgi:hypothetical protein